MEVVDQLDSEAMRALTVLAAATQYSPRASEIDAGLILMENLIGQLLDGPLPLGRDWMDHLDVLGAVRVSGVESFREFGDLWSAVTPGYLSNGLTEGSETIAPGLEALMAKGLPLTTVPHALKPGFVRLPFPNEESLRQTLTRLAVHIEHVDDIVEIASSSFQAFTRDDSLIPRYLERLDSLPSLGTLHGWWKQLPTHCHVTPVGRVLARANANRLDGQGLLPPLD